MSQEEWLWVKILVCTGLWHLQNEIVKKKKNYLSYSPDSAYSHSKLRQCKEKKTKKKKEERMECFLTFWSVIVNLLLKIVRKKMIP